MQIQCEASTITPKMQSMNSQMNGRMLAKPHGLQCRLACRPVRQRLTLRAAARQQVGLLLASGPQICACLTPLLGAGADQLWRGRTFSSCGARHLGVSSSGSGLCPTSSG